MSDGLWEAIRQKDWERLKELVSQGVKENFDDFDYKDYGLIFEVIWSKDPQAEDIAIWWLDHGYPPAIRGGRQHIGILHAAAAHGMPRLIEKVLSLSKWISVNDGDYDGNTAITCAAKWGQTECVRTLLSLGANVHGLEDDVELEKGRNYDTPLHVAANPEIAELLLDAGASCELTCYASEYVPYRFERQFELADENLSPVTTAIATGKMDVAKVLLERGAKLENQALRFLAIKSENANPNDAIELINMGLSPDGAPGKEPLRIGARSGNAEFCRLLIKLGAKRLPEALLDAVKSGDLATVKVFLKKGIGNEENAFRLAAKRVNKNITNFMLYAYPDLVDAFFFGAIDGCDFQTARQLINSADLIKNVDLNFQDESGKTPLMTLYSINRRIDLYRFMRNDQGRYEGTWNSTRQRWLPKIDDFDNLEVFEFNFHRPDNWNDLLKISEDDALALAIEMIKKGADIHAKDNMGRTALWHACSMCWTKSIPFLAKLGLDITERDMNGDSAFDAGCLCGESLTIRPMFEAGAIVDAQDENGDTALIKCAKHCLAEKHSGCLNAIMTLLEDFNANPDLKNKASESARSLIGNDKKLKWLLQYAEKKKE